MGDHTTTTVSTVSHGEVSSSQTEVVGNISGLRNSDEIDVDKCENNDIQQHHARSTPSDRLEHAKLDEEGLSLEYDVVVCGTGLVQSILASALARAGKSVLHCDGADYYGELDAVWTLPMIEELLKSRDKESHASRSNSENCEDSVDAYDTITLLPEGGRASLRWHHSHCSSSLSSKRSKYNSGIRVGTNVKTPFGDGIVRSIHRTLGGNDGNQTGSTSPSPISLEIELNKWKLANGRSPTAYINSDTSELSEALQIEKIGNESEEWCLDGILLEEILHREKNIRSMKSVLTETILKHSARSLALDVTPSFVLASGRAVRGMLASGVADYLEFKTVDGLYWLEKTQFVGNKKKNKSFMSKNGSEENDDDKAVVLSRVPCSKNDVFGTKLLAPMEKRRFMKFIQLTMDYATKVSVAEEIRQENDDDYKREERQLEGQEEVHSLNERHLNQGRSLARPQNKAVDTGEIQILQEVIENESMNFDEFLSKKFKLSPKLRSIVRYALAWEIDDSSTTLAGGMSTLRKHLQALGRYGTTAFLVPLYGSGELSQAFCRSAAVFGATYLLRRAPLAIQIECFNDHDDTTTSCDGKKVEKKCVKGIVLSNDMFVNEYTQEGLQQQPKAKPKVIKCSQVIVPVNAINDKYLPLNCRMANGSRRRIMRRISVFSGNLIESDSQEQRHVIFIPPQTMGNMHAIHGILLDSSVSVAPRGCTVLHLTTTVLDEDDGDKNQEEKNIDAAEILKHAQATILQSKLEAKRSRDPPIEIYHASFSYECPDLEVARTTRHPIGLHLCSHTAQVLTADDAFEQAESIFSSICPNDKFLGLSTGIDNVIRERAEEKIYDDDEKNMLDSALGMIDNTPSDSAT